MSTLIKSATIIHNGSPYHLTKQDILVEKGKITKISTNIDTKAKKVITGQDLYCSIGLCDIGTHIGEPGYEHRETMDSLTRSALAGGYSALAVFPNAKPITQSKADIQYLQGHNSRNTVEILPIGALSKDCKGIDIAEYMDMAAGGAIAFSDGMKSINDTGLMSRSLQYAAQNKNMIIHHPDDHFLSQGSEMHEGNTSTILGMKGVSDIAELHHVQRDILLNDYNAGNLVLHAISSARSVAAIQIAKNTQNTLWATVAYMNLLHTDEDMKDYDSNLKVIPVLRSTDDKTALIQGLKDNVIDAIVSNHTPLEEEAKNLEFTYATPGAIGLETCLAACIDKLSDSLDITTIIHKMTVAPRQILHMDIPEISEGATANLCIFDRQAAFTYDASAIQSLSTNSPYIGETFQTKVLATLIG